MHNTTCVRQRLKSTHILIPNTAVGTCKHHECKRFASSIAPTFIETQILPTEVTKKVNTVLKREKRKEAKKVKLLATKSTHYEHRHAHAHAQPTTQKEYLSEWQAKRKIMDTIAVQYHIICQSQWYHLTAKSVQK